MNISPFLLPTLPSIEGIRKKEQVFNAIVEHLKSLPLGKIENHFTEILKLVMTLVENMIVKSDKVDKKELVIQIFQSVYPQISQDKIKIIETDIEFLLSHGLIIKVSTARKYAGYCFQWIIKKFC